MFRLLLSLLFLPAVTDACGFPMVYNESMHPRMATVKYSNDSSRLFRGPSYKGGGLPPWVPLKIHTVYHDSAQQINQQSEGAFFNYVNKAIKRLGEMLMVRKTEKIEAKPCRDSPFPQQPTVTHDHNFVLYIDVRELEGETLAQCGACDIETVVVDPSSRRVYHEYDAEFMTFRSNIFGGRPVVGGMAVNKNLFINRGDNDADKWISTMMHEISHALVFSPYLYAQFVNCDETSGACQLYPDQQMGFKGPQKVEAPYEIPGIVKKVNRKWLIRSGEKDHPVHVMTLPVVTKAAAEYFNCPQLDGVELENQGGGGTSFAHLEMRIFAHDTMAGARSEYNAFSKITLSFFEASGWYKVDYKHADRMFFGRGLGCDFAMKSCGHYKKYPYCFDDSVRCSDDRTASVMCNSFLYNHKIPSEYDYFELKRISTKGGGTSPPKLSDFCPYYSLYNIGKTGADSKCTSPKTDEYSQLSLQTFSKNARCFQLKKLQEGQPFTVKLTTGDGQGGYEVSHGCYEHKCENGQLWIKPAGGQFLQCHDGQLLSVNQAGPAGEISFQIHCPTYRSLCERNDGPGGGDDSEGGDGRGGGGGNSAGSSSRGVHSLVFLLLSFMFIP